jgi:adenosine deaminase
VANYAEHPIKRLADQGVKFCLNTDDPGISAIDIAHEYDVAAPAVGLTAEQVRQSQLDGLEMAFLSSDEKAALLDQAQT